ncbi:MAG: hypothetical protein ABI793_00325 [Flavobacterium sp.]
MKANTKYNFRVLNNTRFQQPNLIREVTRTYEFSFEKITEDHSRIELRKFTFKINANDVALGTAAKIIQEYTKAVFPLKFDVQDETILLCNHKEIIQRLEAKNKELKLKPEYFVEGNIDNGGNIDQYSVIDSIGDHFMGLATKEGHAMARHYLPLGFLKMLLFCMYKSEDQIKYEFLWNINLHDCNVLWTGEKRFDPDLNAVIYKGEITDSSKLIKKLKNSLEPKIKDALMTSDISHKTKFLNEDGEFDFSETEIKIKVGTFYEFQETLYVSAINKQKVIK